MATEGRRRHPVGLFDARAKAVFVAAQRDAERREGKVLVSGLMLYAAANAGDQFSTALLALIDADLDTLSAAVDAEWNARSKWLQDQPFTLLNEAFEAVAATAQPDAQLKLSALLAEILGHPDSMATRIVRRVGGDPKRVAEALRRTSE